MANADNIDEFAGAEMAMLSVMPTFILVSKLYETALDLKDEDRVKVHALIADVAAGVKLLLGDNVVNATKEDKEMIVAADKAICTYILGSVEDYDF